MACVWARRYAARGAMAGAFASPAASADGHGASEAPPLFVRHEVNGIAYGRIDQGVGLAIIGAFPLGGTSLLIMVGVALQTMQQVESQLMQRNYEGFLR